MKPSIFLLIMVCVYFPSQSRADKAVANGQYLLQKFSSLLADAKVIKEGAKMMDEEVLLMALEDLRLRLMGFKMLRKRAASDSPLFPAKGKAVGDALLFIDRSLNDQIYFLSGIDAYSEKFEHEFEKRVVAALKLVYDRLLFLNGKPSAWMRGAAREVPEGKGAPLE